MPASPCSHAGTGLTTPSQGSPAQEDVPSSPDDASDEIMDRLVKSVTHSANPRPCPSRERRRSRGNRKSCESPLPLSPHPVPLCPGRCALSPCSILAHPCVPVQMLICHLSVPGPIPCPCSHTCSISVFPFLIPLLCRMSHQCLFSLPLCYFPSLDLCSGALSHLLCPSPNSVSLSPCHPMPCHLSLTPSDPSHSRNPGTHPCHQDPLSHPHTKATKPNAQ